MHGPGRTVEVPGYFRSSLSLARLPYFWPCYRTIRWHDIPFQLGAGGEPPEIGYSVRSLV